MSGVRSEIKTLNDGKELFYKKSYVRIGINTDNDLPLNKPLRFPKLIIIIRCVFQEGENLYTQIYLDECLYEYEVSLAKWLSVRLRTKWLWVRVQLQSTMIQPDRIEDSKGVDLDKTDKSKECKICYYSYFDNGFKCDPKTCNRCDWGIKYFGSFAIIDINNFSYRFFMFEMTEEDVIEFLKDFEPDDESETTFEYKRTDILEGIDIHKTNASK